MAYQSLAGDGLRSPGDTWVIIEEALVSRTYRPRPRSRGGRPINTGRFRNKPGFIAEVTSAYLGVENEYDQGYGAQTRVADILGISRRTLSRALRRWGLTWPPDLSWRP